MFEEVARTIHVCIPFRLLKEKYLALVLERRINPEIGIDGDVIDTHSRKDFKEIARLLREADLSVSLHGPFSDLVPGAADRKLLAASRERLKEFFELLSLFDPISVVCHTGYDEKRYHGSQDRWLETSLETWSPFAGYLKHNRTMLLFENVYEKQPDTLLRLLEGLNAEKVGFCLDTGHVHAFSETPLHGWLKGLDGWLRELHLHDNDGTWDHHWAVGAGEIDFEALFAYLDEKGLRPIMTVEAHAEEWLWQSLEALDRSRGFRRLVSNPHASGLTP